MHSSESYPVLRAHSKSWTLLGLAMICCLNTLGCGRSPVSVIQKSRANRESFAQVYCEFTVTVGLVKNAADEEAGRLSQSLGQAQGYYAKKGDQEIIVIKSHSIPETTKLLPPTSILPVFLRTRQYEFAIYGGASSASISAVPPHKISCEFDPWYLNPWARTGWIDDAALGLVEKDKRAQPTLRTLGNEAQVECKSMGGLVFTFDASKNYLAVAMGPTQAPKSGMRILAATQHGSNWFPKTKLEVEQPDESDTPSGDPAAGGKAAYVWEATKLEFREPTDEEMQYQLTSDCEVTRYMEVTGGHKLSTGTTITAASLSEIFAQTKPTNQ